MEFHKKALYNLLKFNHLNDSSLKYESWQIKDLRIESEEKLFNNLKKLDVEIDKSNFLLYAENCDTPEELSKCLILDTKTEKEEDQIYLIIFELWRRFLPEKKCLSIFGDEIDFLIYRYQKQDLETDELIQDVIENLQNILNENVDDGKDPKEVFSIIMKYCAHNLEDFLYEYISEQIRSEQTRSEQIKSEQTRSEQIKSEQINNNNYIYATELIEGFYSFMFKVQWFDFLRIKIAAETDIINANDITKNLIQSLEKNPDIILQLEILKFMIHTGDPFLFLKLARITVKEIKIESEFLELMDIVAEYFCRLDKEEKDKSIHDIINKRSNIKSINEININDPHLKEFENLLSIS